MLDRTAAGGESPRAFLRIGGLTVSRQQLALAQALGCERVIGIASGLSPDVIALQHLVEAGGAQFHLVGSARALVGLVSAVDEVFVFDDGLFVSTACASEILTEGQAVLVQPAESGVSAGFERIDLSHASAGAMRLPGRLIERLADLPADCDASSALLRIALQSGVRRHPIPVPGEDGLFWNLVRTEADAHGLEPAWIRQRTKDVAAPSPARGLALFAVRSIGPALLHAGSGSRAFIIAAGLAGLLAFGSGWFGLVTLGLSLIALGWFLRETAVFLSRIEGDVEVSPKLLDANQIYGWLLDLAIVVLAGWSAHLHSDQHVIDRLFPPFMLVAILRILPRLVSPRWGAWFADRALLAALLAAATTIGILDETIKVAASLAVLAGLVVPFGQSRLTRL